MTEKNIENYGYKPEQKVEITGALFTEFMDFVQLVKQQEIKEVMLLELPKAVKKGEVEYNKTTVSEFFSQSPQEGLTFLGAKALSLQYQTSEIHLNNIDKGVALSAEALNKFQKVENE